jgi:hypothetical protein
MKATSGVVTSPEALVSLHGCAGSLGSQVNGGQTGPVS